MKYVIFSYATLDNLKDKNGQDLIFESKAACFRYLQKKFNFEESKSNKFNTKYESPLKINKLEEWYCFK